MAHQLGTNFTANFEGVGDTLFEVIENQHPFYIYRRHMPSGRKEYEYFKANCIPAGRKLPNGATITEEQCTYPKARCWGKSAFTAYDEESARSGLQEFQLRLEKFANRRKQNG